MFNIDGIGEKEKRQCFFNNTLTIYKARQRLSLHHGNHGKDQLTKKRTTTCLG